MKLKKLGVTALSLGMVFGAVSCGSAEPSSTASASPEASINMAKSKSIETVTDILPLENEKVFTADNYLVTTSNDTRFTVESYGQVKENSRGLPPAEGEVFHAVHFTYQTPEVYNIESPGVSFTIDGETSTEELALLGLGGTLIISAPEDADIAINIQTEIITQSLNLKTAERLTEGIVDVWYAPYEGTISIQDISKPVGNGTAIINMNLIWSAKAVYDEEAGWAEEGKQTWVLVEMREADWQVGGNTVADEMNKAWLTDESGKKYDLAHSREIEDGARLLFMVPADAKTLHFHTSHSGKIMNGEVLVEEIPETIISESTITFQ